MIVVLLALIQIAIMKRARMVEAHIRPLDVEPMTIIHKMVFAQIYRRLLVAQIGMRLITL
ncbi:MAG TPA: hypothetical protein PLC49_06870 [Caldisericia bacterium]|nr:hypothetical protein [Caldisericia bacterium]